MGRFHKSAGTASGSRWRGRKGNLDEIDVEVPRDLFSMDDRVRLDSMRP